MKYIEKQKAVDAAFSGCGACMEEIESITSIDIIFCKDCKYSTLDDLYGNYWCNRTLCISKVDGDGFCKWAKERSGQDGADEK